MQQGQKVYFPDNTQDFHLNDVNEKEAITVRGVKVQTQARFEAGVAASASISATSTPNRPIFTMKKPLESTVKITKASINRMSGWVGKEFEAQIFIDIREDSQCHLFEQHDTEQVGVKLCHCYIRWSTNRRLCSNKSYIITLYSHCHYFILI